MNIFIINLDSATDRLFFQKTQCQHLGLQFTRIAAITPQDIPSTKLSQLAQTWERPLRPNEVSCFLSHQSVWQRVFDTNEPALILEDDALCASQLPELLPHIESFSDMDYLTLETRARKKLIGTKKVINADFNRHRLYQDRTGAAGYILWPSGAAKLLLQAQDRAALADAFLCASYQLNAYQLSPAAIIQLDQCNHYRIPSPLPTISSIASTDRPLVTGIFYYRRLIAQLRMGLRFLCHIHHAKRVYIDIESSAFEHTYAIKKLEGESPE